ncbi:SEL1-like repeat protein [Leisingera caerulea]|uniref:sel1 repeat family protein n=1 Tax=Leisingera caerulea TaxID=506591 RepID=UPI0004856454|nr:sel1 repeat family protein [Leisingera caerulea]
MFWKKKTIGGSVSYGNSSAIADRYNSGVGFLQVGLIDKAIGVFSELLEEDHPSAIYNLALLYSQGHGERLMLPEAPQLMRRAAELGHEGAARYYAIYEQFQGFKPEEGSGLSTCLGMVGDGTVPLILINAISMDLLLRMGSAGSAYLYVVKEFVDLMDVSEKADEFMESIGFQTKEGDELASLREPDDPAPEVPLNCQAKMAMTMKECVDLRGMRDETAMFIRFSVAGIICKAHSLIDQCDLPPIEFYQE